MSLNVSFYLQWELSLNQYWPSIIYEQIPKWLKIRIKVLGAQMDLEK